MDSAEKYLPRTWTTKKEAELLERYATQAEGDIFEIGTFRGGTTELFARCLNPKYAVFTIDPYFPNYVGKTYDDYDAVKIFWSYFSDFPNVFLIVGRSQDLGVFWNKAIAVLFIDGAHDYESVKTDFEQWAKFVPEAGFVIFHDSQIKGVKTVLKAILTTGRWEVCEKANKITVLRRIRKGKDV